MNLIVLFQLLFSIIYSIFSKKISISTKVVFAISLKGQFFFTIQLIFTNIYEPHCTF